MFQVKFGRRVGVLIAAAALAVAFAVPTFAATPQPTGNTKKGKTIFKNFCGSCHVMKAAATTGTTGPNLDKGTRTYVKIVTVVTNGSKKNPSMMAYKTLLTKTQITDVATFVFKRK
jgi:mono/diheme cytochrome c family protein